MVFASGCSPKMAGSCSNGDAPKGGKLSPCQSLPNRFRLAVVVRGSHGFPPEARLRRHRQFEQVRSAGRKIHTVHFIIIDLGRGSGPARLGVTVSRKVGGAVQRNRVKRLLREFFRRQQSQLPAGTDFSIIAKRGASVLDYRKVCDELNFLCICADPVGTSCSKNPPSA